MRCVSLSVAATALVLSIAGPAVAEEGRWRNPVQLAGLEDSLDRITGLFGRGREAERGPESRSVPAQAGGVGELQFRVDSIESQMRTLTGQVEALTHQMRLLQEQLAASGGAAGIPMDAVPLDPAAGPAPAPSDVPFSPAAPPGGAAVPGGATVPGAAVPPTGSGATGAPVDLSGLSGALGAGAPAAAGVPAPQAPINPVRATPEDEYDLAYGMFQNGDYAAAETGFRRFLEQHPSDPQAADARYWLGESLYRGGDLREAADTFLAVYTEGADSARAPDSLAQLGFVLSELGEKEAACATFSEFENRYPGASGDLQAEVEAGRQSAGC